MGYITFVMNTKTRPSSIRAYLSSTLALDLSTVPSPLKAYLHDCLTLQKRAFVGPGSTETFFLEQDNWLHIPRGFALSSIGRDLFRSYGLNVFDARGKGCTIDARVDVTFGAHPFPEGQPEFISQAVKAAKHNCHGGLLVGPTRAGKTLTSLEVACRLGGPTLILVDNTVLMDQWRSAIEEHVLVRGVRVKCGIIRESQFEYGKDFPFSVAMLQTLARRSLPEDFRMAWRSVILDECSNAPCDQAWGALQRISSSYVFGLSATPDRSDGLDLAIQWIIGPEIARLRRVIEADVYFVNVRSKYKDSQFRRPSGDLDINKAEKRLMADEVFVNAVVHQADKAVKADRRVLFLVNHRNSVEQLVGALREMGHDAGMFMSGHDPAANMVKNPVIGTYKMCAKGVDFLPPPTVLGLVGPKSDIRQAMGRGLQPQAKKKPIILDFVYRSVPLMKQACRRLQTYRDKTEREFTIRNMF